MDSAKSISLESAFMQDLKDRLKSCFGDIIFAEIQNAKRFDHEANPENIINLVSRNIAASEKFVDFGDSFVGDVGSVLNEDGREFDDVFNCSFNIRKDDSFGGSLSSLNSSCIDFLTSEQLSDITASLSGPSALQRMEALSILYKLSSLEHIVKQALWSDTETKLHDLMLGDVNFLRTGSLRIFTKMLSSPEPQIVREGFASLVKFISEVSPNRADTGSETYSKFIVKVLSLINKFQQNVPVFWLRYPQKVVEDIVNLSVTVLEVTEPPVCDIISVLDPSAKYLTCLLHGGVARLALFSVFRKRWSVPHMVLDCCTDFLKLTDTSFTDCCTNDGCRRVIHSISFLACFLQYSEGRSVLNDSIGSNDWINVMETVMQCAAKMCEMACLLCCSVLYGAVGNMWFGICGSERTDISNQCLLAFELLDVGLQSTNKTVVCNKLCLISSCLSAVAKQRFGMNSVAIKVKPNFMVEITKLTLYHLSVLDFVTDEHVEVCCHLLGLLKSVLSVPLIALFSSDTVNIFADVLKVVVETNSRLKLVKASETLLDNELLSRCENEVIHVIIKYVQRPLACVKAESDTYNSCVNVLFDRMCESFDCGGITCPCEARTLLNMLCYSVFLGYEIDEEVISEAVRIQKALFHTATCDGYYPETENPGKMFAVAANEVLFLNPNADFHRASQYPYFCVPDFAELPDESYAIFVLDVLSVVVCNIYAAAVLIKDFGIQSHLMDMLSLQYVMEDGVVIIDDMSVLLNYIIVKLYTIGGPGEWILPQKSLKNAKDTYEWPFVTRYPPQAVYRRAASFSDEEYISTDLDFIAKQNRFVELIKQGKQVNPDFLLNIPQDQVSCSYEKDYLESMIMLSENTSGSGILEPAASRTSKKAIIDVLAGYGSLLGLWSSTAVADLEQLLVNHVNTCNVKGQHDEVFVVTVFFMFKCDASAASEFVSWFAETRSCSLIWNFSNPGAAMPGTSNIIASFMEFCDFVIMETLPSIYSAFQMCNTQPSIMYGYWMKQYFWNYLDFAEISNLIVLLAVFGSEYSVYFFASVLSHQRLTILRDGHDCNLLMCLKSKRLCGYRMGEHIEFILGLGSKYSDTVNSSLQRVLE